MHILQIEIDNFKSFSGKSVIPFEPGFTTVSGPNGSGKSNIIDAMLFCLGLSTSRTMRAEKLTDLINHKSKRREAIVTMAFGENAQSREPTLVISRRIKDSGGAQGYNSTYYLNGRTATLTEIHERLGQDNISPGAYNVLMQGDVTGIINMSPMERRKIIDEVAGVAEFDRKIDQAQKEIETTTGSIERFELLMGELNGRLEQLSGERQAALKYQGLLDEKKQLESQQLAAQYLDLKASLQANDASLVEARHQKSKTQTQLDDMLAQLEITRAELNEVAQQVKRKGEDQQIALKKQIESLKGSAARKQDTIQFNQDKTTEHESTILRCTEEQTRLQLKMDDIHVAVEGFEQHQSELVASIKEEKEKLAVLETQLLELNESSGELTQTHQHLRQQLQQMEQALQEDARHLVQLETQQFKAQQEQEILTEQLDHLKALTSGVSESQASLETRLRDAELEKTAFEAQIQQKQLAVSQARVAYKEGHGVLQSLQRQLAQIDAQKRAFDEVQFGRAIDTVLQSGIAGVHGTLSQLATGSEESRTALEVALGGRIKNIVVDHDGVAQQCIELLKRSNAGRATFLPLNKIQGRPPKAAPPRDPGIVDYAYNMLSFDPMYSTVFAFALGETVIVETMDAARRLLTKYRMVTLDGELMEKSGAMTGGFLKPQKGQAALGSNQLDEEHSTVQAALNEQTKAVGKLEQAVMDAEMALDDIKQQYGNHLGDLKQLQIELKHAGEGSAQLQKQTQMEAQLDTLKTTLSELATTYADAQGVHAEKQQAFETLQAELASVETELPADELNHLKQQITTIEFQIRALESKHQQVANDIQSRQLEREFHEKAVQQYHDQIQKCKDDQKTLRQTNETLAEEIRTIEQQMLLIEHQAGELDEELKQLQEQRDEVQERLIYQERLKSDHQRQLAIIDEQMTAFGQRRHQLQEELKALAVTLKEADINPDDLSDEDYQKAEEIVKQIQKLTKQMEQMGAVNMRAIEDYAALEERHHALTEKIATLNREKTDLLEKIDQYGELKRRHFNEAFEAIDGHFREIFAELSDGDGHLVLTNPLDPLSGGLTIQAKPRGKTTIRLESMSGGEKSLTALAFVFAFQRYLPAPFYAFDEVDMFLDGVNAEKLAQMVKKQASRTQFIVVSLRKPMLEQSERTIGVTQKQDGITKVTGVLLKRVS